MIIRKLQLAIMAVGLAGVMAAPNLFAYTGLDGTIYFSAPTYQNGTGGEFNAVTTGLGSFPTLCLEDAEYIGQPPSGPYTYTINSGGVAGGPGANVIDPYTGLAMDNISKGTAWLFSQFSAGTLTLDDGTGSYFDANRLAHAGELQQAIWFLEDETAGQTNAYVTLVENALGTDLAGIKVDSNGAYGVVALNLFSPDGSLAQDQLTVPEPTTTGCFLLGLGALVRSRRFAQNRRSR
jgi:hypothetical protein